MKVFLSYSTSDKKLAGKIKLGLEEYGLDVFLTHEDIKPSAQWINKILTELEACHCFLPILTENFNKSGWTNQETGVAFARRKIIIPLKTKTNPHGFISQFQALKLNKRKIKNTCLEIIQAIASGSKVGALMKTTIIKKFGESKNYIEAAQNTELLLSFRKFTIRQVTNIIKHAIRNDQIFRSYGARRRLKNFVKKHEDKIGSKLLKTFYEVF